jgi:hypothetical protein
MAQKCKVMCGLAYQGVYIHVEGCPNLSTPKPNGRPCTCGMGCNPLHPPCKDDSPKPLVDELLKQYLFDHMVNVTTLGIDAEKSAEDIVKSLNHIINREKTLANWKERLSLLKALEVLYKGHNKEPFGDFGDNLAELIKESKAKLQQSEHSIREDKL